MKTHITKYFSWFTMALTISSCSCCREDKTSLPFSTKVEKMFSVYQIGDTINFISDTCNLKLILKNIIEKNPVNCSNGTNTQPGIKTKDFNFDLINDCSSGYVNKFPFTISIGERGNDILLSTSKTTVEYIDSTTVSNILFSKIYKAQVNLESKENAKRLKAIFFDSLDFKFAINENNNIYFKK
ncbi:MAG: hypothetical protein U0V72_04340 [Cytophagales bacterium]